LQADTVEELYSWAPRTLAELERSPQLADVNSDQQDKGLETQVTIDRDTAARLGINVAQIDNTLYNAYGQRQVSTIYKTRQQYHVIMEVAPQYWQEPETLRDIFVSKAATRDVDRHDISPEISSACLVFWFVDAGTYCHSPYRFKRRKTVDVLSNLRTAKALGLTVPTALRVRANEVIE
jgi:multidrug efflux pump subunit AcrB